MKAWVLDTNVVVSGFLTPRGPSARLLDEFFAGRLRLLYDQRIIAEYGEVLARPECGIDRHDYIAFLMLLRAQAAVPVPPPVSLRLPDYDDLPFIEVALSSEEKVAVTKNLAHFRPAIVLGLKLMEPREAVLALS